LTFEFAVRLLGVDYGKRNIGVAFSVDDLIQPLKVISGKNWGKAHAEIIRLAYENKVKRIILGTPLNFEGRKMKIAQEIERFGELLKSRSKLEVVYFDEAATTKEAQMDSLESGLSQKARRSLDSVAAAILLNHYVESKSK